MRYAYIVSYVSASTVCFEGHYYALRFGLLIASVVSKMQLHSKLLCIYKDREWRRVQQCGFGSFLADVSPVSTSHYPCFGIRK